jgi:hypothetical protein
VAAPRADEGFRQPRQWRRERDAVRTDDSSRAYAALAGLLLFLLTLATALWQVTSRATARDLIERGLVALTDIDLVLSERREELRTVAGRADGPVEIPGYPLAVLLTREEALNLPVAELRFVVLRRSSALIYEEGLGAFDRTGEQSFSLASSDGLLVRLVGRLNADTHSSARVAMLVLLFATAGVMVLLVLKEHGFRRSRTLGAAALAAGLVAAFLAGVMARVVVDQLWGGDPFEDDIRSIVTAGLDIALRDALIVAAAGVGIILVSVVCQFALRAQARAIDESAV